MLTPYHWDCASPKDLEEITVPIPEATIRPTEEEMSTLTSETQKCMSSPIPSGRRAVRPGFCARRSDVRHSLHTLPSPFPGGSRCGSPAALLAPNVREIASPGEMIPCIAYRYLHITRYLIHSFAIIRATLTFSEPRIKRTLKCSEWKRSPGNVLNLVWH